MKSLATIYKEFLLLIRDPGGLALLFIMPIALVIVMALVQDAPFREYQETKLDVLFADQDNDSLGARLTRVFGASPNLRLHRNPDTSVVRQLVHAGKFKAAIVLPPNASARLREKSRQFIDRVLVNAGIAQPTSDTSRVPIVEFKLIMDPTLKPNFKQVMGNEIDRVLTGIQADWIVEELQRRLADGRDIKKEKLNFNELIHLSRVDAAPERGGGRGLNSVQHNVPAWTMFAMFFILYPLAGNFIKEREEGSLLRLRLISGSQAPVVAGKFAFYFIICLLQFVSMLCVGLFVMPLFGLDALTLGSNTTGILVTAISVAIAAVGYGTLIAIFFKTAQQALSFGSISVVILSAFGGVWVPVYVMPVALQSISGFSPLNWGLESFNDLFLRNADLSQIAPNLMKLLIFGAVALATSVLINKSRTVS